MLTPGPVPAGVDVAVGVAVAAPWCPFGVLVARFVGVDVPVGMDVPVGVNVRVAVLVAVVVIVLVVVPLGGGVVVGLPGGVDEVVAVGGTAPEPLGSWKV